MKILFDAVELKNKLGYLDDLTIGFIPTMGALHQGHISLVEKAKEENDIVVVSIFLNATQFDNEDDLNKYPSTMEDDRAILDNLNVDFLFIPNYAFVGFTIFSNFITTVSTPVKCESRDLPQSSLLKDFSST